jgi:hypothetical protein
MKQAWRPDDRWTVDEVLFLVLEGLQWAAVLGLLAVLMVLAQ